eukprot:8447645-Alexandrium_andersonii.AAC.1
MLDFGLFCSKLKACRGWGHQKCKTEWEKLKKNPALEKDNKGTEEFPVRVEVPANLVGEDWRNHQHGDREEKRLIESGK